MYVNRDESGVKTDMCSIFGTFKIVYGRVLLYKFKWHLKKTITADAYFVIHTCRRSDNDTFKITTIFGVVTFSHEQITVGSR